jgi:hypothetical protein
MSGAVILRKLNFVINNKGSDKIIININPSGRD